MKKKINIQTLAGMTERGFKEVHREAQETNDRIDKLALATAHGFKDMDTQFKNIDVRFKKVDEAIETLALVTAEGFKGTNKAIQELATVMEGGFKEHDKRIVRLEKHVGFAE